MEHACYRGYRCMDYSLGCKCCNGSSRKNEFLHDAVVIQLGSTWARGRSIHTLRSLGRRMKGLAVLLGVFLGLCVATGVAFSQDGLGIVHVDESTLELPGFVPAKYGVVTDDYNLWNKFRVFATAIAKPRSLPALKTAYAVPGEEYISVSGQLTELAQAMADSTAIIGRFMGTKGDIFVPFAPPDIDSCEDDVACWTAALSTLKDADADPWSVLMFDRAGRTSTATSKEIIFNYGVSKSEIPIFVASSGRP